MVMRKVRKKVLAFSVIAILILFQAAAAHSYYDSLIEADFLGTGLKFEAADVDTLYVDKQNSVDLATGAGALSYLAASDPPEPFPFQNSAFPSSVKIVSILRC